MDEFGRKGFIKPFPYLLYSATIIVTVIYLLLMNNDAGRQIPNQTTFLNPHSILLSIALLGLASGALISDLLSHFEIFFSSLSSKILLGLILSSWILYSTSVAYGDVNRTILADPGNAPITVAYLAAVHAISLPFFLLTQLVENLFLYPAFRWLLSFFSYLFWILVILYVAFKVWKRFNKQKQAYRPWSELSLDLKLKLLKETLPMLVGWDSIYFTMVRILACLVVLIMSAVVTQSLEHEYPQESSLTGYDKNLVEWMVINLDLNRDYYCRNLLEDPLAYSAIGVLYIEPGRVVTVRHGPNKEYQFQVEKCEL